MRSPGTLLQVKLISAQLFLSGWTSPPGEDHGAREICLWDGDAVLVVGQPRWSSSQLCLSRHGPIFIGTNVLANMWIIGRMS